MPPHQKYVVLIEEVVQKTKPDDLHPGQPGDLLLFKTRGFLSPSRGGFSFVRIVMKSTSNEHQTNIKFTL